MISFDRWLFDARTQRFVEGWLLLLAIVLPISIAVTSIAFFPLAILYLVFGFWTWRPWPPTWGLIEKTYSVFIVVAVIASFHGIVPRKSFKEIEKDLYFFFYVLPVAMLLTAESRDRIAKAYAISTAITGAIGIIQYLTGFHITDVMGHMVYSVPPAFENWPKGFLRFISLTNDRAFGTRSHPLTYSEGLLAGLAYFLAWLPFGKSRKQYVGIYIAIWLLGGGLLFSQSRGPWLAAIAMGVVTFLLRAKAKVAVHLCCLCLPIGLVLFFGPKLVSRAETITSRDFHSNAERLQMWHVGHAIFRDNPLLGIGPGNVKRVCLAYQDPAWGPPEPWGHLHSTVVNFAAERGGLGVLTFFLLIGSFLLQLARSARRTDAPGMDRLAIMGVLAIVGFLVAGLTETNYNDTEILMMFYFSLGLALSPRRSQYLSPRGAALPTDPSLRPAQ